MKFPNELFVSDKADGHVQGIAVDEDVGVIYLSLTTKLIKADFSGKILASVKNLAGHLGCITLDKDRGRIYGSLELKHDVIGQSIIARTGWDPSAMDSFYIVSFDLSKMTGIDMDAERDGVMTAMFIADVAADYAADDPVSNMKHRYGCSGMDGTAYGPVFGESADSRKKIMTAYGIYSECSRADNDNQVILQFDPDDIDKYARPLSQSEPHRSGPEHAERRYFLYTGNTSFGVQNLEYDEYSRLWLVAVYPGEKEKYSNFNIYFIDGTQAPTVGEVCGREGEEGLILTLAKVGERDKSGENIYGIRFPNGDTGIASLGEGDFCFSIPHSDRKRGVFGSTVIRCRLNKDTGEITRY